eukprot:1910156-Prymnesium_polylepis.1
MRRHTGRRPVAPEWRALSHTDLEQGWYPPIYILNLFTPGCPQRPRCEYEKISTPHGNFII